MQAQMKGKTRVLTSTTQTQTQAEMQAQGVKNCPFSCNCLALAFALSSRVNIANVNTSAKASKQRVTCPPSWKKKISTASAYLTFDCFRLRSTCERRFHLRLHLRHTCEAGFTRVLQGLACTGSMFPELGTGYILLRQALIVPQHYLSCSWFNFAWLV